MFHERHQPFSRARTHKNNIPGRIDNMKSQFFKRTLTAAAVAAAMGMSATAVA